MPGMPQEPMLDPASLHAGNLLPTPQLPTSSVEVSQQSAMLTPPMLNLAACAAQVEALIQKEAEEKAAAEEKSKREQMLQQSMQYSYKDVVAEALGKKVDATVPSPAPSIRTASSSDLQSDLDAPVAGTRTTNLVHLLKALNAPAASTERQSKPREKLKRKAKERSSSDSSKEATTRQRSRNHSRSQARNRSRSCKRGHSSSRGRSRKHSRSRSHKHKRSRSGSGLRNSKQDPRPQGDKAEKQALAFDLSESVASAAKLAAELRKKRMAVPVPVANSEYAGFEHIAAVPPPPEEKRTYKSLTLKAIQIRALLGKGGATINEIRRRSGSDIKIHHPPSEPEGTVSIVGNAEVAQTVIESHLAFKGCPMQRMS